MNGHEIEHIVLITAPLEAVWANFLNESFEINISYRKATRITLLQKGRLAERVQFDFTYEAPQTTITAVQDFDGTCTRECREDRMEALEKELLALKTRVEASVG